MKILQVISSFPPAYSYGGPAKAAYEISKALVKKGHEVTVYTTDVYDADKRYKYKENPEWVEDIQVYHFKNISNKLAYKNLPIAPSMAFALNKNVKKFDIIHLHEYRTFQAILVHHYAKKYGIPYILQPRGSLPRMRKNLQKKLFDIFFGAIVKDASKIIATSKMEADQYKKVFQDINYDKVVYLPNGIDLKEFENLPKKGEFRKKYSIPDDEKIILYLGRIHEIKGLELLLAAYYSIVKEMNTTKLVIAGPDNGFLSVLKKQVEKLNIKSRVLLIGPLYGKEKLEAFVDADVFVLPSKYESFGNVALEALICGTPVIITDRCGISEWIKDMAWVVRYDEEELKNAILYFVEKEKKKKTEQIKENIAKRFDWSIIAEKLERIYETLV